MKLILIAVDVYENGISPFNQEWESLESVTLLSQTIHSLGYEVKILESPTELINFISSYILTNDKENLIVLNLVEGYTSRNREGYIPAICESMGICHAGSDAYAQIISLDKNLAKNFISELGIKTPDFQLLTIDSEYSLKIDFPLFLKPNGEGSSLGINHESIVRTKEEFDVQFFKLKQAYDDILVEEFISGDDITIGVIGNPENYQVTEPGRVLYDDLIYSATIKSKSGMPESLAFDIPQNWSALCKQVAIRIASKFKVRGFARIDFRLSANDLYFLEINLTPGLSKIYSTLPKLWEFSCGKYHELIQEIITLSVNDYTFSKRYDYGKRKKV